MNRDAGSSVGKGAGGLFGANASLSRRRRTPSGRIACRRLLQLRSRSRGRPARFRVITDPRDPTQPRSAARRIRSTAPGALGTAFENRGTSQPKFDARVDQELSNGGRMTYEGGVAGTSGIIYTGIGPFDIQSGIVSWATAA